MGEGIVSRFLIGVGCGTCGAVWRADDEPVTCETCLARFDAGAPMALLWAGVVADTSGPGLGIRFEVDPLPEMRGTWPAALRSAVVPRLRLVR